jgi:hypothetical protein
MIKSWPLEANTLANAIPMPLEAPVINAVVFIYKKDKGKAL